MNQDDDSWVLLDRADANAVLRAAEYLHLIAGFYKDGRLTETVNPAEIDEAMEIIKKHLR